MHERITNALKYDALSVPDGRVFTRWVIPPAPETDGARVTLDWREVGGPPVTDTGGKSFGSMLIRNSLAHDPAGRADRIAAPDGVRCQFVVTAKAIVKAGEEETTVEG